MNMKKYLFIICILTNSINIWLWGSGNQYFLNYLRVLLWFIFESKLGLGLGLSRETYLARAIEIEIEIYLASSLYLERKRERDLL